MNTQNEIRRLDLWWVWNYEREQQRLDKASAAGLHLVRPGKLWSFYNRDDSTRYVYRLDYQTGLRTAAARRDYLNLYQDAGWTHIGSWMNWRYFRREWSPVAVTEIYTDKESLKAQYNRIRTVLGVVFLAEMPILFVNAVNTATAPRQHISPASGAVAVGLLLAAIGLLGYGFIAMTRKIRRLNGR